MCYEDRKDVSERHTEGDQCVLSGGVWARVSFVAQTVKASAYNAGDLGSIPGSGRSPGEGNGNPLQYSCLENPMGGGAWWATVHGVEKGWTRLSDFIYKLLTAGTTYFIHLKKCYKCRATSFCKVLKALEICSRFLD